MTTRTEPTRNPEDVRAARARRPGLALAAIALVALVGAGVVGVNLVIDPDGPDFNEIAFALGWATIALAVAGVALVWMVLRNERATLDPAAPPQALAHGASEPLAPPVHAPEPAAARRSGPTPFGDIYPVIEIQGIGETYAKRLEQLGITDTEQLWEADTAAVSDELDVPARTVEGWQAMAELMALDDIGPQYAELLMRSGITSIEDLAAADPEDVAGRARETESGRDVRIQGNRISAKHTQKWVRTARTHKPGLERVRR